MIYRKLYAVLYNILESCYGANLGFELSTSISDTISRIIDGQRQLDEWRLQILPSLGLRVWDSPMTPGDVEIMDVASVIRHRFSVVLSVRYNNLRILLHRRCLERFLESYQTLDNAVGPDKRLLQQMGLTSVVTCVESAISIISTVYSITSCNGWRRELLGAWNYSLYYSRLIFTGSHKK